MPLVVAEKCEVFIGMVIGNVFPGPPLPDAARYFFYHVMLNIGMQACRGALDMRTFFPNHFTEDDTLGTFA